MILLLLAVLGSGNEPLIAESRCDWVELNHYGECVWCEDTLKWQDREILCQVIFWDGPGRKECVAWRMADKVRFIAEGRGVVVTWSDGDVLRRVRAKFATETWTTDDPEFLNRDVVRAELRRGIGACEEQLYPSLRIMRAKATR
jgi:hypothetical protein